jgi:hypothetical protein
LNGWLYKSKYAKTKLKIAGIEVFIEEPTEALNLEVRVVGGE